MSIVIAHGASHSNLHAWPTICRFVMKAAGNVLDQMKVIASHVGVWIDWHEAMIISLGADGADVRMIRAEVKEHVTVQELQRSAPRSQGRPTSGLRSLDFVLEDYLDRVLDSLGDARHVIAFGPAGPEMELGRLMARRMPQVECDRMITGPMSKDQRIAWVKRYFASELSPPIRSARS